MTLNFTSARTHPRSLIFAAACATQLVAGLTAAPALSQTPPAASQTATRPTRELTGITERNGKYMINFQDVSIDVVLDELSAAAGFIVVKEVRPEGRVTLVSRQAISGEEAISLLNTVLRKNKYAAIQQDRILKIVDADAAKRLNIPVHTGSDPDKIANTDELITQVIPLKYADATQLKTDLQPLINADADFTSNASANSLVITDTSANVKRVVQIVADLDTSVADSIDVKVFQLRFANSTDAAKLINDVFGNLDSSRPQGSNGNAGGGPGGGGFGGPGGGGFGGGGGGFGRMMQQMASANQSKRAKITAAADTRTNSVVVTGPTDALANVDSVIQKLDSNPQAQQNVFVYRLRNAQALNLEAVLNALFNGTSITGRSQVSNADRLTQARKNNSITSSSSTSGGGGGGGNTGRAGTVASSSGGQMSGQAARLSNGAQQTIADLADQVSIIAETDTNSILVRTAPANWERVRGVLDELDHPVQQVLIKVLLAEVTHDKNDDIGADLSVLNLRRNAAGAVTGGQQAGGAFGIPAPGAVGATGLVVQLLETNFSATIRALEEDGKIDVLSRPYILASDNQLASITVGQEVPFVTRSSLTDAGQLNNTIEYRDIGILLDVIPHINPDGMVILDVAPEISTLLNSTVQISNNVAAPLINKRSAQSRVSVRSGQTIVIGGLMQDSVTSTVDKVPLLGDIPYLGNLFKRTSNERRKTELLIFLTPHIAADPNVLTGMGADEVKTTKLLPGSVGPGVYEEHRRGLDAGEPPASTQPQEGPSTEVPQGKTYPAPQSQTLPQSP